MDIVIPKFREHAAEEMQARVALLARYAAKKETTRPPGDDKDALGEAPGDATGPSSPMEVSSSSEDTSDEAFLRKHTVEEEKERAKYEGRSRTGRRENHLLPLRA